MPPSLVLFKNFQLLDRLFSESYNSRSGRENRYKFQNSRLGGLMKHRALPRVSVVMATFNGACFLRAQLASFLAQTHLPDELIVCDDRSTDGTFEILEEFAVDAPFAVHIERNATQLGVLKNFECALIRASGDIIFLSDQDDVWFENKISSVLAEFAALGDGVHVVLNDQVITDENLVNSGRTKMGNLRDAGMPIDDMVTGCCTAMTHEFKEFATPIPSGYLSHDDWVAGLARLTGVRSILQEPLQYYRRHTSNVSHAFFSEGRPPKKFRGIRSVFKYGLSDSRTGWEKGVGLRSQLRDRIAERRARCIITTEIQDDITVKLTREIQELHVRIALCSRPRYKRPLPLIKFLFKGGYRSSRGLGSALKDLLRKS